MRGKGKPEIKGPMLAKEKRQEVSCRMRFSPSQLRWNLQATSSAGEHASFENIGLQILGHIWATDAACEVKPQTVNLSYPLTGA
jgi:hypothetical protein